MNIDRRRFLQNSAVVLGGMPMFTFFKFLPEYQGNKLDHIEIYNTKWGFGGSLESFCSQSKALGYDGIEVWVPAEIEARKNLVNVAKDHGLKLGLLAGNNGDSPEAHLQSYKDSISNALECEPSFINCHAGKDYFTFEENSLFIEHSIAKESETGIPIHHESHRGRILFNAVTAEQFLKAYDQLFLTLDISHWTVVHESLLGDQKERVDLALSRTRHVHSRVGFQEAPQIPNPSSEHYENAVKAHFAWWDRIVDEKAKKGAALTMTTEFGPPPYMWTHPDTGKPLAEVWDMNVMMMKMWKERYG
ncbi:sugar phosphate isomerase/epimerase family protein [Portibacter marinus]|uniref:sugar phosphate isomerase/epimerase family protein n=1 Tax=Portibacter marinus TaxID=2898660 RepID=UPI001F2E31CC|nr:TIM barrel protein [Portibacter marinus]